MVNKETMLDRERRYPQPSFESYTLALAATAEADLASFLYQEGEEMSDFEHDITLWMKGVNLGEEAADISAKIETKQGRGRTYTLNTDKFDTGDGVLDESTPDGILTALAVTKAKLLAVRPLMEEIYPALSWEADEYIKYLDQAVENIISPKQDKRGGRRVHYSLKDTLSDLFTGTPASRRYAGLSLLVLTSLVLASCKPVETTSTVTPDVEPTRVRATEVTSAPTEVVTQVTPQTTPSPTIHISTPTEDTRTKTPTVTVMPTITSSPEATSTTEIASIPFSTEFENVDFDSLPFVNYEDIQSGKLAEIEMQLIANNAVEGPGNGAVLMDPIIDNSDAGGMFKVVRLNLSPGDPEYNILKQEEEKRPYRTISVFTTSINETKAYVYGVAYTNKDGSTTILHYAFENIDGNIEDILRKAISGEYYSLPISKIYCGSSCDPFGWIDYSTQPALKKLYSSPDGQKISGLIDEWVKTGNIPSELQNILLLPLPFFYPY